jgi:tripartite ATP-independent transporter DctP family solute receptor
MRKTSPRKTTTRRLLTGIVAGPLAIGLLAACSGIDADAGAGASGDKVTLSFANSYGLDHPHNLCGTDIVAESVADAGITIELFASSQLGADAARFTSVLSGDIDIDLQGSSGIAATYPAIGVMDMAYVFNDVDHLFNWFDSPAADAVKAGFTEATGAHLLDVWYFGNRTFSANEPIRTPDDLEGLRMRFPDSPVHLANAAAMGADPVAVAFEETYLALQQGIVDGQENPIASIDQMSFNEVQEYVSLSEHSVGSQLVVMSGDAWDSLSAEQQTALETAVSDARATDLACALDLEEAIVAEWKEAGTPEVIEDVDRDAFIEKAEAYFTATLEGEQLEIYTSIRDAAGE